MMLLSVNLNFEMEKNESDVMSVNLNFEMEKHCGQGVKFLDLTLV